MSSTWFTSDTHFNHKNIITYCGRNFDDLDSMTESLVSNWNNAVREGDTVYHLGDFALSWGKKHEELIDGILRRLNGQKHLIVGNHDRDEVTRSRRWVTVSHYKELKVAIGGHQQAIVLCHYPLRSWNQQHYGSWMLHGHCHGTLPDIGGKIMDVGVDCHQHKPISLSHVSELMGGRPKKLTGGL